MNDYLLTFDSRIGNMFIGSLVKIVEEDLREDNVHLNDAGLAKLANNIISKALRYKLFFLKALMKLLWKLTIKRK
jgi:hypothetical protein